MPALPRIPFALTLAAAALLAAPAAAQAPRVAILNARVAGHDGLVTVLVDRGAVRQVGAGLRVPQGALRLDAGGGRVVPGRIDAWAGLPGGDPLGSALDAFDPYDRRALEEALAQGVTSVLLTPSGAGLLGQGALVKLRPGVPLEQAVVTRDGPVCASLGRGTALARAAQWQALRDALDGARAYRDAWLDYEEALTAYEAALGVAPVGSSTPGGVAPVSTRTPPATTPPVTTPPAPGPTPDPPPPSPDPPRGRRRRGPPGPGGGGGGPPPAPSTVAPVGTQAGPQKPPRPARDRLRALLVRVLEGELPLRVEAHGAADLLNALDLQDEEARLRLVLVGASEGHRVAEALASRGVSVVLGPTLSPDPDLPDDLAARLAAAGVPVVLGSGAWRASRFVDVNARLAAGAGWSREDAEDAVTARAADLLGVGARLGRVAPGYDADLVVLAPEGAAGARVEVVLVGGEVAFRRRAP